MKILNSFLLLIFISACASRTPYQSFEEDEGGYRHKKIEENLMLVNFVGNKETEKDTAILFASFRAIEMCKSTEKKYAHLLYISGDMNEREVERTYTPGYYGISPFYSGFGYPGTSFAGGFGTYGGFYGPGIRPIARTYEDTITYPEATALFECANEVYESLVEYEEVGKDAIAKFSKDEKSSIRVVSVPEGSPNKKNLQKGDIIFKAAGQRIHSVYELTRLFGPQKQIIDVQIIRSGMLVNTKIQATEVTKQVAEKQAELIKKTCNIDDFEHPFCKD